MWESLNTWLYGLVSAILAGAALLIRKVFTNASKIELLERELSQRNNYRKELDDQLASQMTARDLRVDDQLSEIRHDIKNLLARNAAYERLLMNKIRSDE